jgi:hypothetical protein
VLVTYPEFTAAKEKSEGRIAGSEQKVRLQAKSEDHSKTTKNEGAMEGKEDLPNQEPKQYS